VTIDFTGEFGGLLAAAWALGAGKGYMFGKRQMQSQIESLQKQVNDGLLIIKNSENSCEKRIETMRSEYALILQGQSDRMKRLENRLTSVEDDRAQTLKDIINSSESNAARHSQNLKPLGT
jgi:hypothetical protein